MTHRSDAPRFPAKPEGLRRIRCRGRSDLRLGLLMLVLVPGTLQAQEGWRSVAQSFAQAWGREDARAVQDLLAPSVRLQLEGQEYVAVTSRQAVARIERVFRSSAPARPEPTRSGGVDGGRERAFAEFSWATGSETEERRTFTLFLGFRLLDGHWRVTELRLLR